MQKDLLPFKMQFPETRHIDQIGPCFFPSSACLLLLIELCESPGQALRRHFGKHEHLFSQIRRGVGGGGDIFVCPCEREGQGGGGREGVG